VKRFIESGAGIVDGDAPGDPTAGRSAAGDPGGDLLFERRAIRQACGRVPSGQDARPDLFGTPMTAYEPVF
jgi:hypothetical protein